MASKGVFFSNLANTAAAHACGSPIPEASCEQCCIYATSMMAFLV